MNIEKIAKNIEKGDDGIYYSKGNSKISYPEAGNANCMQIEENSFWFSHRNKIISTVVSTYSKSKMFFDIGGGNGFVSKALQTKGIETVLVEPGIQGAKNAKKRNLENIVCSTLEEAQFEQCSLGAVGLFDVVEHIENDIQFLTELYGYLENGEYIFITVPAFNMLWSKEDDDTGHYRRYSLKELEKKLKTAGFSIEYSTYFFSILPFPIFLFRSLPSKLGINSKSNDLSKHQKEHKQKSGILNTIINKIWNIEESRIKKMKRIRFGGSCLVVGKKNESTNR